MTAGENKRSTIWRINYANDDVVGGAVITGTSLYTDVYTRFQGNVPSQLLLQQGLETQRTFNAVLVPGTMDIRERDELEITFPPNDTYYGNRFRIVGVLYSDFSDYYRKYIIVSMVRSVRAHVEQ